METKEIILYFVVLMIVMNIVLFNIIYSEKKEIINETSTTSTTLPKLEVLTYTENIGRTFTLDYGKILPPRTTLFQFLNITNLNETIKTEYNLTSDNKTEVYFLKSLNDLDLYKNNRKFNYYAECRNKTSCITNESAIFIIKNVDGFNKVVYNLRIEVI